MPIVAINPFNGKTIEAFHLLSAGQLDLHWHKTKSGYADVPRHAASRAMLDSARDPSNVAEASACGKKFSLRNRRGLVGGGLRVLTGGIGARRRDVSVPVQQPHLDARAFQIVGELLRVLAAIMVGDHDLRVEGLHGIGGFVGAHGVGQVTGVRGKRAISRVSYFKYSLY